jgi:predicted metal-dependent hydrolase
MVEYTLIRSSCRTLGLEITRDLQVIVRAPKRCSLRQIEDFVIRHEGWIREHTAIQARRAEAAAARAVTPEQEAQLRRLAVEYIPQRVAFYAPLVEVTPTGVKITSAERRFGSCSGKNSLCFSWRLMQYAKEAIDYVVVHELCHIRHHNHFDYACLNSLHLNYYFRYYYYHFHSYNNHYILLYVNLKHFDGIYYYFLETLRNTNYSFYDQYSVHLFWSIDIYYK